MTPHHAVLYVTDNPRQTCDEMKERYAHEAEIIDQEFSVVTIADVRKLIAISYQTPGDKMYRLLLVRASTIAPEAQHALLKILEEPPRTTKFAFVLPDISGLLPTVLSRVLVVDTMRHEEGGGAASQFATYLSLSVPERLTYIADIAKKKDESVFNDLFSGLVMFVTNRPVVLTATQLAACAHALHYLRQRGASKKMIWEELSLSLPVSVR